MWWNHKNSAEQKEQFAFNFPPPKKRNELFPKLEKIVRQAEEHFDAGDFELAKDVLHLMWRTIDKVEEMERKPLINVSFEEDVPKTPIRDTNDSQITM